MSRALEQYDNQQTGVLSLHDFNELMLRMVPRMNAIELERRYKLAEKDYGTDKVILERLVGIGSYMIAYTSYMSGWLPGVLSSRYLIS